MSDTETTVAQLKDLVSKFRDERDWKQFHTPKDLAVSISIEAGELLELFQWRNGDEVEADLQDPGKLRRLREEVADIVVYCLNMSDAVGFDLAEAIVEKLQQNAAKYPADKARGNAKKYTEL